MISPKDLTTHGAKRVSFEDPDKTAAEIFADRPVDLLAYLLKPYEQKNVGDGVTIGGSGIGTIDMVGINYADAKSLLQNESKKKRGAKVRIKGADGGSFFSIFPCLKCAITTHRGILKGSKRSVPKKQHIINHWRKQLNNYINKNKHAIVVDGNSDLNITYRELDEFSNSIAFNLKQLKFTENFENLNPNGELVIAVCQPACYEYVVVLLAILKLGAAILPIGIELPAERIAEIVKLTRPILLIASPQEDDLFEEVQSMVDIDIMYVDEIWNIVLKEGSLDKCVLPFKDPIQSPDPSKPYPPMWKRTVAIAVIPSETHEIQALSYNSRAFLNKIKWDNHFFVYLMSEFVLLPPCFETVDSISEVMTALIIGVTLIAYQNPTDVYIPEQLFSYCSAYKIRRLTLWPSLLKACATAMQLFEFYIEQVSTVRYWFCVGGVMRSELAELFFELLPAGVQLIHMYHLEDSSSAATFQTYETLVKTDKSFYSRLSVGYPVPNMNIYVLDSDLKPVTDDEIGEIYVSGVQLPCVSNLKEMGGNYIKNPFSKDKDHQFMVKTMDFGRVRVRSNGTRMLIHEMTRSRHYYIDNQVVWLQNIEMYIKRLTNLVKKTHCICYRPNEDDQLILAFCVPTSNKVTFLDIEDELRNSLALQTIPEVIVIDEIPMFENTEYPDENSLLRLYQERRLERQVFDGWAALKIGDVFVIRAAKVLCYVLFTYLGVPLQFIVEHCWQLSYLSIRRATVVKAAFIVKELHRNRYPIYIEDFIYAETLQLIAEGMVEARRERGYCNRMNCPTNEVIFLKNRYKLEIMASGIRASVCSLLARCFTQRGQLDYYAEVGFNAMRKYFDTLWPMFVSRKLSIVIRKKKEKNNLIGAVLSIYWHDEFQLKTSVIPKEIAYKLELIHYLESGLTDSHFPQDKTHVFQVCYIALDANMLTDIEIQGLTDKMILTLLAFGKVKGFEAIVIITYDYFCYDICLNSYGFLVAKQCQVNEFVASDGTRPYALCPDYVMATIFWKLFDKVHEDHPHKFIEMLKANKIHLKRTSF